MQNIVKLSAAVLAMHLCLGSAAHADIWVDKDEETVVKIDEGILSIFSMGDFYFFDELFTLSRKGTSLRLCVGKEDGSGMATDCILEQVPVAGFNNEGKTRSLHFDVAQFPYVFESLEQDLKSGDAVKVSIDNGDIFAAYSLSAIYRLNAASLKILELPD